MALEGKWVRWTAGALAACVTLAGVAVRADFSSERVGEAIDALNALARASCGDPSAYHRAQAALASLDLEAARASSRGERMRLQARKRAAAAALEEAFRKRAEGDNAGCRESVLAGVDGLRGLMRSDREPVAMAFELKPASPIVIANLELRTREFGVCLTEGGCDAHRPGREFCELRISVPGNSDAQLSGGSVTAFGDLASRVEDEEFPVHGGTLQRPSGSAIGRLHCVRNVQCRETGQDETQCRSARIVPRRNLLNGPGVELSPARPHRVPIERRTNEGVDAGVSV